MQAGVGGFRSVSRALALLVTIALGYRFAGLLNGELDHELGLDLRLWFAVTVVRPR
jgi:hypothetical protein